MSTSRNYICHEKRVFFFNHLLGPFLPVHALYAACPHRLAGAQTAADVRTQLLRETGAGVTRQGLVGRTACETAACAAPSDGATRHGDYRLRIANKLINDNDNCHRVNVDFGNTIKISIRRTCIQ